MRPPEPPPSLWERFCTWCHSVTSWFLSHWWKLFGLAWIFSWSYTFGHGCGAWGREALQCPPPPTIVCPPPPEPPPLRQRCTEICDELGLRPVSYNTRELAEGREFVCQCVRGGRACTFRSFGGLSCTQVDPCTASPRVMPEAVPAPEAP